MLQMCLFQVTSQEESFLSAFVFWMSMGKVSLPQGWERPVVSPFPLFKFGQSLRNPRHLRLCPRASRSTRSASLLPGFPSPDSRPFWPAASTTSVRAPEMRALLGSGPWCPWRSAKVCVRRRGGRRFGRGDRPPLLPGSCRWARPPEGHAQRPQPRGDPADRAATRRGRGFGPARQVRPRRGGRGSSRGPGPQPRVSGALPRALRPVVSPAPAAMLDRAAAAVGGVEEELGI